MALLEVDVLLNQPVEKQLLLSLKHILNMLKTFFLTFGVTSVAGANKVGDYMIAWMTRQD